MNLDLKAAYERSMDMAREHTPFSIDMLKELSSIVMRRTGGVFNPNRSLEKVSCHFQMTAIRKTALYILDP